MNNGIEDLIDIPRTCGVLWILGRKYSRWVVTSLGSLYRNLYVVSSISPRFFSLVKMWFISWVMAGVGSCRSSWYVLVSDKCWESILNIFFSVFYYNTGSFVCFLMTMSVLLLYDQ